MSEKTYSVHDTACIDHNVTIGNGTKIWHFSHIMKDSIIGERCNIGQNVVISPGVILGKNVKIQNNVSHQTIVNSSNYITSDEEASKKFLELGLGAENMEFYSVLWVAKKLGIKAKGFFVVTNNCFCDAKTEYIKNLSTAKDIIYDRYIKELKEYE